MVYCTSKMQAKRLKMAKTLAPLDGKLCTETQKNNLRSKDFNSPFQESCQQTIAGFGCLK